MPAAMLQSQLDTLEEPNEETESVIVTSIVSTPDVQAEQVLKTAGERDLLQSSA
jgi:gluconokinase